MKSLKAFIFIIISVSIFVTGLAAQTNSEISVQGVLSKAKSDNKYSIGEYSVKLPNDKADSYQFYFDPYVGQEIKFRGTLIGEKLIVGDDIWYDGNSEPTKEDYPQIVKSGETIEEFIPKDWVVLQKAVGDLNGDTLEDVVLAMRGNNLRFFRFGYDVRGRIQFLTNPISNVSASGTDGNPRILVVLLKDKNGYKLQTQNNSFLPISRFGIGESLDKIEIGNGELELHFSYGDPHWGFIEKDFFFKFSGNSLLLIRSKFIKNLRYGQSGIFEYDFVEKLVKVSKLKKGSDEKVEELRNITIENSINLDNLSGFDDVERLVSMVK